MCLNMFQVVAQDLCKEYRIYARPLDRLFEAITRRPRHRVFTVLSGVSFALAPQQSLGIIGDNGAGKSTLLKLLAGTVTPSRGKVEVSGRVAALLELGAGFHPEFTGRQNIFLNASLLGISKEEIAAKDEEIIAFSELGDFIDRPVKTYSSGMYVRLAFAIATTVDPDILVIDEALSVGDMAFQRKCIDRMNLFRDQGKTMIFCSHSMYHVQELCDRVIWLDHGRIRHMGPSNDVVAQYEDHCKTKRVDEPEARDQPGEIHVDKDCRIRELGLETKDGHPTDSITPLADVAMKMEVEILKDDLTPQFGFALVMPDETICSATMTHHDRISCGPYRAGEKVIVRLNARDFPVREGTYRLIGAVAENSGLLWYEYKHFWPVKVKVNPGIGLVTFRREWDVRSEPS